MKDYENTEYWKAVQEFVTELKTAKYWLKPDGKPNPEWKLFEADSWDAAWDAACEAAWDGAWNTARNEASKAARNAARNAARDGAWDGAWDAAWDGARRNAAGDAAWDAVVFARMLVCIGLEVDTKHLTHLNARMEVWRKGYALLCDVDGVLYVYAKK